MRRTPNTIVKRRKVFYIPGFDPFPPRRYRELYRTQGAEQAAISGYHLSIAACDDAKRDGWLVTTKIDGIQTHTVIDVLVWSDIVRRSFDATIGQTYLSMARTIWMYLSTGTLWRLMRLRKGPVIAALYPVFMLSAQLSLALFIGFIIWQAGTNLLGLVEMGSITSLAGHLIAACLAFLGTRSVLRWFRKSDGRIFAYYLMHDFAHSASHRGAYPPDIRDRLCTFQDRIAAALQGDFDEVLVVGHSSGAHLAVTVLAQLLRQGQAPNAGPALGLLSLGQVAPMVSFLPNAHQLRADLRDLSACEEIAWVDVSAPGDGCSFALCDPVAVCGQASDAQRWPLVFSAAFTQSLSLARRRALRGRFFRLHFQYLCAFDQPKDYDYFQITGGPVTLRNRFADRPPSRSRITRATSKYVATRR